MGKKGKRIRPCHVCKEPVKFELWQSETDLRRRPIYHWCNPDGSHHDHKLTKNELSAELRSMKVDRNLLNRAFKWQEKKEAALNKHRLYSAVEKCDFDPVDRIETFIRGDEK